MYGVFKEFFRVESMKLQKLGTIENPYVKSIISTQSRLYLCWLKSGEKTAEGRVNTPAWRKINVGEWLMLKDNKTGEYLLGTVSFKHEYETFEDMLSLEGVHNMLPFLNVDDLAEGVKVYKSFPGANRVYTFGCVAIGIKVEKNN